MVAQLRAGGGNNATGDIHTKEFDFGPDKATLKNGYLTYLSSSQKVTVLVYIDGQSTAIKTIPLDASAVMVNDVQIPVNQECRLISFRFQSTAADFEVELFRVPNKEITPLDRR